MRKCGQKEPSTAPSLNRIFSNYLFQAPEHRNFFNRIPDFYRIPPDNLTVQNITDFANHCILLYGASNDSGSFTLTFTSSPSLSRTGNFFSPSENSCTTAGSDKFPLCGIPSFAGSSGNSRFLIDVTVEKMIFSIRKQFFGIFPFPGFVRRPPAAQQRNGKDSPFCFLCRHIRISGPSGKSGFS